MKIKSNKTLFLIITVYCFLVLCALGTQQAEKVSKPNQYSGYSSPQWEGFTRKAAYVTMPDGVKQERYMEPAAQPA